MMLNIGKTVFILLVNRNQSQRIILELSDLGHRIGSFSTTQYMQK